MKNKKVDKVVSDYFRKLQKKSWAKRKADLLKKVVKSEITKNK